jgi:predicted DNA-binding transcriptional regulator AlpA
LSPLDKLLIDMAELAQLTSLSVRHLRRLDSSRDVPGRVAVGRRVLYQTEAVREWVRAGLPDRDHWPAALKRSGRP